MEYCVVFAVSLLSATLLPLGSEGVLLYYASEADLTTSLLWLAASIGNTLGGMTNWFLGLYLLRYHEKKWFPISPALREKSAVLFNRYGQWSLLLTWLPIVGDGIALVSGVLRTSFWVVLPLVFIGKAARYALILWGQQWLLAP
ncbi:DedA family protein [Marinomonas sp. A79]|uniref:DedA family protein n=1 Tax=Marinomonas vulgaris TaxID=2823372 RepID=A0ABS5HDX9_9GAMM|nr:YqaA family protein [Marinomonas vulgaris]MBR7889826.1 DedA family protein [Marinomonas vulgaris]